MSASDELGEDAVVSFTVRELFGKLDGKLDKIDGKLDGKVDRKEFVAYVEKAERRFNHHGDRIGQLETSETARRGVRAWQGKTWATLGAIAALIAAIAAAVGVAH